MFVTLVTGFIELFAQSDTRGKIATYIFIVSYATAYSQNLTKVPVWFKVNGPIITIIPI